MGGEEGREEVVTKELVLFERGFWAVTSGRSFHFRLGGRNHIRGNANNIIHATFTASYPNEHSSKIGQHTLPCTKCKFID